MKFPGAIDRRELKAVAILWLLLMAVAFAALLILQQNAHRIVYHLEYVAVNRYQKAGALYLEAEKRTLEVLKKRQAANAGSVETKPVPADDLDLKAAHELFAKAFSIDPREKFSPEQERCYKMLGDLAGAAGQTREQQIAYARAAISRRDYAGAELLLKRASESAESDTNLALALAELAFQSGRKADVATELQKLPEQNWSAEAHVLYARTLQDSGKLPEASAELQKALKSSTSATDVRKHLAGVYSQLSQPVEALKVLEEGRAAGGESDGNYMHILGDLLRTQNRAPQSVTVLEQAAKLEPNSGSVQLSLAKAYEATGQKRKASRALQRATTLDPKLQGELLN